MLPGPMSTAIAEMERMAEYRMVADKAGRGFVRTVLSITLGIPVVTYLLAYIVNADWLLFYAHISLAAVWVGTDFFFRYSLAPAVGRAGPETAMSLIPHLTPRLMTVGESLTLGVIGSGIGLAHQLGYFARPTVFVWGALVVSVAVIYFAFVPLHHYQIEMLVELDSEEPDGERVGELNDRAMTWLMGMTILLLLMLLMMVGMRGLVPL